MLTDPKSTPDENTAVMSEHCCVAVTGRHWYDSQVHWQLNLAWRHTLVLVLNLTTQRTFIVASKCVHLSIDHTMVIIIILIFVQCYGHTGHCFTMRGPSPSHCGSNSQATCQVTPGSQWSRTTWNIWSLVLPQCGGRQLIKMLGVQLQTQLRSRPDYAMKMRAGIASLYHSVGQLTLHLMSQLNHLTNSTHHIQWQWVTLTFDLACRWAFRWAKIRSKSRLKSKSKVISLSESLRPNLRSKYRLRPKLSWTLV